MRFIYFCSAIIAFCSCGTAPTPVAQDTATIAAPVALQTTITPLPPDPLYTAPTEIVSAYGPAGIVRDVAIDGNGVVWLAAWDGIVSYDGKEFTNHTLKSNLSHHRIYSVLNDSKGNLWFGSMGAGVYRYDGAHFTNLNTNNGLANNNVMDIFEDAAGNVWFATDSGVSRYDGKVFMNITHSDGLIGNAQAISQDRSGNIWIGTSYGLFTCENDKVRELLTEYGTHYSNVRDLYCNHSGTLYIAAARGLYMCNGIPGSKNEITLINDRFTGYVCEDRSGNLLLTTDVLCRFDGTTYDTIAQGKSNLGIFGASEDSQGNTWYGAMDGLHKSDGTHDQNFHSGK